MGLIERLTVFAFLEGYALGFVRDQPLPKDKLLRKALWCKDMMLSPGTVLPVVDDNVLHIDHGVAPPPMFIMSLDWLLDTIDKNCRYTGERRAKAMETTAPAPAPASFRR
jgi:hypothetical protein